MSSFLRSDLLEYSVVYTDRTVNLMSNSFGVAFRELQEILRQTYNAHSVALIPGSGTFAMESAARAFGKGKRCLIIRNGFFSFRWTQILDADAIASESRVLYATRDNESVTSTFTPPTIESVLAAIAEFKPDVVFAPHVETSTGILLPHDYIQQVGAAARAAGAMFVLDCIAAGSVWVDMEALSIDAVISAPQKAWSAPAGCGIVMVGERARHYLASPDAPASSSFSLDLKKWLEVADKYREGAFMYYTTLPTEDIIRFRDAAQETVRFGLSTATDRAIELGAAVRTALAERGFPCVASAAGQAPGVIVVYDNRATGAGAMLGGLKTQGVQIAGPVPFMLGAASDGLATTFRIGLFGLDKWYDVEKTVRILLEAMDKAMA